MGGRSAAIFGAMMTAAVVALGAVVTLQHRDLDEMRRKIDDLEHQVRQVESRRPPPVEPASVVEKPTPSPDGPSFIETLAELPKNISASRLLEQRRDPRQTLVEQLQLTGEAAGAVASILDEETAEWVRWVDTARERGFIDETTYGVFLSELLRRTDMQLEDLLDEAQRAMVDTWREGAFTSDEP